MAKIELKEGATPSKNRFYRANGDIEVALDELIKSMLKKGWIVPSKSAWAAQAFLVPKPAGPDGKKDWRLVVDYRYLNSQTKNYGFHIPIIEDLINKQALNSLWSIFDLQDGFHQMHLHPDSRECTAFVTSRGVYHWTVLPMGVKNGPAMFQAMISWIIRGLPNVIVYIDDILVGTVGDTSHPDCLKMHYKCLQELLDVFRKHHLFAKGSKMHLFKEEIKFCGHILAKGCRRAATSKLDAVNRFTPKTIRTVTHMKQFLGLVQYYAMYLKDFARVAVPLSKELKARNPDDKIIVRDKEMEVALQAIKDDLLNNAVLQLPDPYKPYVLEVDSSDFAVGGVLSQHNAAGELRPVAFFSRKLQGEQGKGQVGWSIREKETYAIVLMLQKHRSWLASSQIQILVLTDHESLQHWYTEDLNKMTSSVSRRGRWHEFMSQFNLLVVYVPGESQKVADPLSRASWLYPSALDEADATFDGSPEANSYA
jgi:putative transposase